MATTSSRFGFPAEMFEQALEADAWKAFPGGRAAQVEANEQLSELARNVSSYETLDLPQLQNAETTQPAAASPARPEPGVEPSGVTNRLPQWQHENPGDLFAVFRPNCPIPYLEQFQLLRTQLLLMRSQCASDADFRCICLTSAGKGEGKTFAARNLAATLASASGKKVLLIETGRRERSVPETALGLEFALSSPALWRESVVELATSSLSILPGIGTSSSPDFEPLPSLIASLKPHFDWIVVDAPAIHDAAATEWVIAAADAALLVVREGATTFDGLADASARIPRGRLAGVVMNRMPTPKRKSWFPKLPKVRIRWSRSAKAA